MQELEHENRLLKALQLPTSTPFSAVCSHRDLSQRAEHACYDSPVLRYISHKPDKAADSMYSRGDRRARETRHRLIQDDLDNEVVVQVSLDDFLVVYTACPISHRAHLLMYIGGVSGETHRADHRLGAAHSRRVGVACQNAHVQRHIEFPTPLVRPYV